jgi:hypothetical protein
MLLGHEMAMTLAGNTGHALPAAEHLLAELKSDLGIGDPPVKWLMERK